MDYSPDLSNSITMHPHLFHMHPNRPESARSGHRTPMGADKDASTTALEVEPADGNEPTARHVMSASDVEGQQPPQYTRENDPYNLSAKFKSATEIAAIRANSSRKRDGCGPLTLNKDAARAKKLQGFYETQNENIERLLKPVDHHVEEARREAGDNHLKFQIAIYGSLIANIVLSGLQLYGAIASGSLSLFTTMADAVFDPLSNVALIVANRAVSRVDPRRFPSGKARLETVGNISFCFIMIAVSSILIAFSIKDLVEGKDNETNGFHLPAVIAVAVAFLTKFCLFLYCWALKDKNSQIMILWKDHRNDLLINGFGILTSVGGSKLKWWIDPMGAIILSVIVSVIWLRTAFSEFLLLVGVTGPVDMHQLLTYTCLTHSPEIIAIDTVRCYHSGPRLIAEVDVVMAPEATLRHTHDVAEELQIKIESLPDIERAYVHVDYETTHKPEHAFKKDM